MATTKNKNLPNSEFVESLVSEYEMRSDESILLAIQYIPESDSSGVYIFQVIDPIGWTGVGTEEELFEVEYPLTYRSDDPAPIKSYHITTTNPVECITAIQNRWPRMMTIVDSVNAGNFRKVRTSEDGDTFLKAMQGK